MPTKARTRIQILLLIVICLISADYLIYTHEERVMKQESEKQRHLKCLQDPKRAGCEKEASDYENQLRLETQRQKDEERAIAKREERIKSLKSHCAALARQHLHMTSIIGKASIPEHMVASNIYWHDAGCNDFFGSIRQNIISQDPSLPEDWMYLNYRNVFSSRRCTVVGAGPSGLMSCEPLDE